MLCFLLLMSFCLNVLLNVYVTGLTTCIESTRSKNVALSFHLTKHVLFCLSVVVMGRAGRGLCQVVAPILWPWCLHAEFLGARRFSWGWRHPWTNPPLCKTWVGTHAWPYAQISRQVQHYTLFSQHSIYSQHCSINHCSASFRTSR